MELVYQDTLTELWCGDCRDYVKDGKHFDLLLTDPPYGLNKSWKRKWHGSNGTSRLWGRTPEWDQQTIEQQLLATCITACESAVVWGGNFYDLPPSRCWLVWDKLQSNRGADCELAWSNLDKAPKCFRMSRIDAYVNKAQFKKVHPAEKPVQLSAWVLDIAKPESMLDPFCGTGNSLVAARMAGLKSVTVY